MKHSARLAAIGLMSAAMTAGLSAGVSLAGPDSHGSGHGYGGHAPRTPHAPHISAPVPRVSAHVFNISVPVPNVHIPMFHGEREKKDKQTPEVIERETKIIERERIVERTVEREVINNNTTFIGGGGGSSIVIVPPPAVPLGPIDVADPTPPKPVKAECIDSKGHLSSAWRVAPAEIDETYEGEVFRCLPGSALGATVGTWVNGVADYEGGFVIECLEGEALRFGQGGRLACAPQTVRADAPAELRLAGASAEVLIRRGRAGSAGTGAVGLGGMVLTGGVGGRVY